MSEQLDWSAWSAPQVRNSLPELLDLVETRLDAFAEEYKIKNRSAIGELRDRPPTAEEITDGSRRRELFSVAYALDALGRQDAEASAERALPLFRAAHELFRSGNEGLQPSRPMRMVLRNLARALITQGMQDAEDGTTDIGQIRDRVVGTLASAWGVVPPETELWLNETLLEELERVRARREGDQEFQARFIRDNVEAVLAMEIPTRLADVQARWEEDGRHYAPAAVRLAARQFRRPQVLSKLFTDSEWQSLRSGVERADVKVVRTVLQENEDALEINLRLRLDTKADYRIPAGKVMLGKNVDPDFVIARDLLFQNNPKAVLAFRDLHHKRGSHSILQDWYAYALAIFGQSTDIYDIVDLLSDATKSPFFRMEYGWTTRWNLACALRRMPPRAREGLDVLLPVLDHERHPSAVLDTAILWALEDDRADALPALLSKSRFYEAHLLAFLYAAPEQGEGTERDALLWPYFRRLAAILREPDQIWPHPKERLEEAELDQLTLRFIEASMLDAGLEWFRQRTSYGTGAGFYKNWECAVRLAEKAGDREGAWRFRVRQWGASKKSKLRPEAKAAALRSLLQWAQANGFEEDAGGILTDSWRQTAMSEGEVALWETRLAKASKPALVSEKAATVIGSVAPEEAPRVYGDSSPTLRTDAGDEVIDQLAGTFASVSGTAELAEKSSAALRLLSSVVRKHQNTPVAPVQSIERIIKLAVEFHQGVDESAAKRIVEEMKESFGPLGKWRDIGLPYELHGLAQAVERVVRRTVVRAKGVADIVITPPQDLQLTLEPAAEGESYRTHVLARVSNRAHEPARNVAVTLTSASANIRCTAEPASYEEIKPEGSVIVEFPIEVIGAVEDSLPIQLFAQCEISGVTASARVTGSIPVMTFPSRIPVTLRYVTGAPVSADRTDLFHGREKELVELTAAFGARKLLKLFFVNGIRRVGKSSLMEHLAARCYADILPVVVNLEAVLAGQAMEPRQFVRQLIRRFLEQVRNREKALVAAVAVPGVDQFDTDPPWVVFENFLQEVVQQAGRPILICLDELQQVVKRIADPTDPMDEGLLAWLRDKVQTQSSILVICTGSEPYSVLRARYRQHHLWGNMDPYDVSFVSKEAMAQIATEPVKTDRVVWLPEALEELWRMTEGHPWITQLICEKVTEGLNAEHRRLIGPADVTRAAEGLALSDPRVSELWWNESEGLITETHRQIAFIILQNQPRLGFGLREEELVEACRKSGLRSIGKQLDQMSALEVLTQFREEEQMRYRIRGGFLELYLTRQMQRILHESSSAVARPQAGLLAIFVDAENVKKSLMELLDELPRERAEGLRQRIKGENLAARLLEAAQRHGVPRQRWAVADWDRPWLEGDQKAFRLKGFYSDIADRTKPDSADHILIEKIHQVLREHPEIGAYIIALGDSDYTQPVRTLLEKGKHVVLWSTERALGKRAYQRFLEGPDRIEIEWLEELVLGEPGLGGTTGRPGPP